jgi:hypothetical protein
MPVTLLFEFFESLSPFLNFYLFVQDLQVNHRFALLKEILSMDGIWTFLLIDVAAGSIVIYYFVVLNIHFHFVWQLPQSFIMVYQLSFRVFFQCAYCYYLTEKKLIR